MSSFGEAASIQSFQEPSKARAGDSRGKFTQAKTSLHGKKNLFNRARK